MENIQNPLVHVKKIPKNGHQIVDVDLILLEPFHIYCNNKFALQIYIHS